MRASAVRIDVTLQRRLMHGFADLSRLRIRDGLRDGERRLVDLSDGLGLSRPNTSKHLACLLSCGLVERDPRGREVFYVLTEGVLDRLEGIDELLDRVGAGRARGDRAVVTKTSTAEAAASIRAHTPDLS
jgi:ArsR family transcriptional regulator, cadmium/lead-responsive transcriptional repressor